jgi:hypothetical protein
MTIDADLLRHSVTEQDALKNPGMGLAALQFVMPLGMGYRPILKTLPELPPYWSYERDQVLTQTVLVETHWSYAVKKAIRKFVLNAWSVEGKINAQRERAQELLNTAEGGKGWRPFAAKAGLDFCVTDSGFFFEIVRATQGYGGRVLGLIHLDSRRCYRTGDPKYPVIYYDRLGAYHLMRDYQVYAISDSPNPRAPYFDIGLCAASSAYHKIRLMAAIETYLHEKITGNTPLSWEFISGMSQKTLNEVIAAYEADRRNKGASVFGGSMVTAFMSGDKVERVSIPFAELPDKFDITQERKEARLVYANCLDLDPQDLEPLGSRGLGNTATQSEMLHEKSGGLKYLAEQLEFVLNEYVLPQSVTFAFNARDLRQEKQEEDVKKARADRVVSLVKDVGILTAQQALQILVDAHDVPKEFLPVDVTPNEVLYDDEKPEDILPEADQAVIAALQQQAQELETPQVGALSNAA